MNFNMKNILYIVVFCVNTALFGQFPPVTLPDVSAEATVSQKLGLSDISVHYHRPSVRGRKVWGELVPFATEKNQITWRAGADENTIITFSHDVKIEGKSLPAGKYGFHALVTPTEWTLIFSVNTSSWGSFFYKEAEDALRIKVKPTEIMHQEMLAYEFANQGQNSIDIALKWEKVQVTFKVEINIHEVVLNNIRNELRSTPAFSWVGWHSAALYCLQNNVNIEEGLVWVNQSINRQANFVNHFTKSQLQTKRGDVAEGEKTYKKGIEIANIIELHNYGRLLLSENKAKQALEIFLLNSKRNPNQWPVNLGVARGYIGMKDDKNALKFLKIALKEAPNENDRTSVETMIKDIEKK